MAFPGGFNRATTKKKTTNDIPVGKPIGKITDVVETEGYVKGDAFTIKYELIYDNGKVYEHSEVFINDLDNPRTAAFEKHLTDNGIVFDDLDELVGITERLTVQKQVRNGRTFTNITEREFISRDGERDDE